MNDLITIIINVYNGEKYIKKCIDSVINQTYKNIEILIINDGSTDNTLNIIKKYKDKRIRVISTENKGLSLSRNVGIDNAKGEYIYFIDVDDLIEKDTIEYLYNISKKNDTLISTCKMMDIFNYNFKVKQPKEKLSVITNKEMLKNILLKKNRSITVWNKLIKKELFNTIRFEDRIIDDIPVTYKLILATDTISYGNQIKYYHLIRKGSIIRSNNPKLFIDIYKASLEKYDNIKKIYPNMIENDISILLVMIDTCAIDSEIINNTIDINKLKKDFKKIFSYKVFISNLDIKRKIKILIFRINPYLYIELSKRYRESIYKDLI